MKEKWEGPWEHPTPCPVTLFLVCVVDGALNSETVMLSVGEAGGSDIEIGLRLLSALWEFQVGASNRHLGK